MSEIKIIALFGESSAGKDTMVNKILEIDKGKDLHKIISCTTRPPRDYEKDGEDYHFLTPKQFLIQTLDGRMLEATQFREWYYGTSLESLDPDKINLGVFNISGIANLILSDQSLCVYPVYVKTDSKTRLLRSLNREDNPDCTEICRRFLTDKKDFEWVHNKSIKPLFEYNVTNSAAYKNLYHRIIKADLECVRHISNPTLLD